MGAMSNYLSWESAAATVSNRLALALPNFRLKLRRDVVVWRAPDEALHQINLVPYTWPDGAGDDAPLALRFAINDFDAAWKDRLGPTRKMLLGYARDAPMHDIRSGEGRLEWTVSWDQTEATIPWLIEFWGRRCLKSTDLPAPPYPSNLCGHTLETLDYGWSAQADAEHDAYTARREQRKQALAARRAARLAAPPMATAR
jgi:hypothetical protein